MSTANSTLQALPKSARDAAKTYRVKGLPYLFVYPTLAYGTNRVELWTVVDLRLNGWSDPWGHTSVSAVLTRHTLAEVRAALRNDVLMRKHQAYADALLAEDGERRAKWYNPARTILPDGRLPEEVEREREQDEREAARVASGTPARW